MRRTPDEIDEDDRFVGTAMPAFASSERRPRKRQAESARDGAESADFQEIASVDAVAK